VRSLRPRKDCRQRRGAALARRFLSKPHLDVLITHQLYARPPVEPPPPILPEKWLRTDSQWVQQPTSLSWLLGGAALPLALRAQRTGAATADAGSIHHAQGPIGFSAVFMRRKLLVNRATQRPIRLESKVLAADSASFPGQAHMRGSIARGGSRVR
jgi:hypothetical protein